MNSATAESKVWIEETIEDPEDAFKQFTKGNMSTVSSKLQILKKYS